MTAIKSGHEFGAARQGSAQAATRQPLPPAMQTGTAYLVALAFVCVVARQSFAAPIRSFVPFIWYWPDAIAAVAILAVFFTHTLPRKPAAALMGAAILVSWTLYSFIESSAFSVFLNMRYLILILLGLSLTTLSAPAYKKMVLALLLIGTVSAIGLILDDIMHFEWRSAGFEGLVHGRNITRLWWLQDGTRRLAGYGIASTDTALILASCLLLALPSLKGANRFLALTLSVLGAYGIWLTAQRASTVWFLGLSILSFWMPLLGGQLGTAAATLALKTLAIAASVLSIALPFVTQGIDLAGIFGAAAPSLLARTYVVWPAVTDNLDSWQHIFIGRGLGSVGEGASIAALRAPDSMFLNFAVMLGVPMAAAMFLALAYKFLTFTPLNALHMGALSLAALLMLNGLTANIVTGPTGAIFLGASLSAVLAARRRANIHVSEHSESTK